MIEYQQKRKEIPSIEKLFPLSKLPELFVVNIENIFIKFNLKNYSLGHSAETAEKFVNY